MTISVHIERLILDGIAVPHRDRPLVQAAVETELARLLATDGLGATFRTGGAVPRLTAHAIDLPHDHRPHDLGVRIARSVYGGMSK